MSLSQNLIADLHFEKTNFHLFNFFFLGGGGGGVEYGKRDIMSSSVKFSIFHSLINPKK